MIGVMIFALALIGFILFVCWLGNGGETSGKSADWQQYRGGGN